MSDVGNPLDPSDSNYEAPDTAIVVGPDEGATVGEPDVTFRRQGNDRIATYSYRLDEQEWSEWTAETSVEFTLLDEGTYSFAVKGRYPTLDEDLTPAQRSFTVDAVKGQALMFRPRKIVAAVGESFTVEVIAEEMTDLMLAHVAIEYDEDVLRLDNVTRGDFLAENGGTLVFLDDSVAGVIDFSTGVATVEPAGVSGSGVLADLTFNRAGPAGSSLTFGEGSSLRAPMNEELTLRASLAARVVGD